jgi:hypothetical protein
VPVCVRRKSKIDELKAEFDKGEYACLLCLSLSLSVCVCVCLSVSGGSPKSTSSRQNSTRVSVSLCVFLSVFLSVYLSVCLSFCLSVLRSVCLCLCRCRCRCLSESGQKFKIDELKAVSVFFLSLFHLFVSVSFCASLSYDCDLALES